MADNGTANTAPSRNDAAAATPHLSDAEAEALLRDYAARMEPYYQVAAQEAGAVFAMDFALHADLPNQQVIASQGELRVGAGHNFSREQTQFAVGGEMTTALNGQPTPMSIASVGGFDAREQQFVSHTSMVVGETGGNLSEISNRTLVNTDTGEVITNFTSTTTVDHITYQDETVTRSFIDARGDRIVVAEQSLNITTQDGTELQLDSQGSLNLRTGQAVANMQMEGQNGEVVHFGNTTVLDRRGYGQPVHFATEHVSRSTLQEDLLELNVEGEINTATLQGTARTQGTLTSGGVEHTLEGAGQIHLGDLTGAGQLAFTSHLGRALFSADRASLQSDTHLTLDYDGTGHGRYQSADAALTLGADGQAHVQGEATTTAQNHVQFSASGQRDGDRTDFGADVRFRSGEGGNEVQTRFAGSHAGDTTHVHGEYNAQHIRGNYGIVRSGDELCAETDAAYRRFGGLLRADMDAQGCEVIDGGTISAHRAAAAGIMDENMQMEANFGFFSVPIPERVREQALRIVSPSFDPARNALDAAQAEANSELRNDARTIMEHARTMAEHAGAIRDFAQNAIDPNPNGNVELTTDAQLRFIDLQSEGLNMEFGFAPDTADALRNTDLLGQLAADVTTIDPHANPPLNGEAVADITRVPEGQEAASYLLNSYMALSQQAEPNANTLAQLREALAAQGIQLHDAEPDSPDAPNTQLAGMRSPSFTREL